jgi:hypothetical protein
MMRETSFSMRPTYKRIPAFHVVKGLPETMWIGSAYEMELMFLNPRSQTFGMDVTMEITKEDGAIGFGDFSLAGTLYTYGAPPKDHHIHNNIIFKEISEGFLQFEGSVEERFNRLNLTVSLSPYVKPGTYTFTLTVTLQYKD